MLESYPTQFTDSYGVEETAILNDGKMLRMKLRGVIFEGFMFDDFAAIEGTDTSLLSNFTLYGQDNSLCSCQIKCAIPIPIVAKNQELASTLTCILEIGSPHSRGHLDKLNLELTLSYAGCNYYGSGDFEGALNEIQRDLPENTYLKACITCQFSDYSVFGNGFFGCMLCYRNCKSKYTHAKTKREYMEIDDWTERVQETYLCDEYERRIPGTGYRG